MELSSGTIGAITAAIAVPLFMRLMQNIKPLQHAPNSSKTFDQLKEEYSKWEQSATLFYLVFSAAFGYGLWLLLQGFYDLHLSHLEPSVFLIPQPTVVWAMPALFITIFASAIPMHYSLLYLLGKERYSEYTEYGNQKFKVDSWKLLTYMSYVCIPVSVVFTVMAFNNYAYITNNKFVTNAFFSFSEKRYTFNEIKEIELVKSFEAPNGNIVRNPYYVIYFSDDNDYNFHRTL